MGTLVTHGLLRLVVFLELRLVTDGHTMTANTARHTSINVTCSMMDWSDTRLYKLRTVNRNALPLKFIVHK